MTNEGVAQVMFAGLDGRDTPVMTRWVYTVDDPFAVTLSIQMPRGRWRECLVGRDLIVTGLTERAGEGDVRIGWSHTESPDVVSVEIRSSDGEAVLLVDRELLCRFVESTTALVPLCCEFTRIDIDAECLRLVNG